MFLTLAISSCNSSNDEPTSGEIISSSSNTSTLVSSFTLGSNKKVLYNLDSVYFSIDQEKNLIYNADSLPKGTDVSHLTVSVNFPTAIVTALWTATAVRTKRWNTPAKPPTASTSPALWNWKSLRKTAR